MDKIEHEGEHGDGFRVHESKKRPRIRALHLYHDLMNLYGDWANTAVLAREVASRGYEAVIDRKSVGDDVDFEAYDFAYIGSGTERSQRAMMRDLSRHKTALISRIEDGFHLLATGNAHELFGRAVTDKDGGRYEALGLLDFETVQLHSRITGDCVCKATFLPEQLIGFVNRAGGSQNGEIDRPFLHEMGPCAKGGSHGEGIQYKNVLGTYMTGPILMRNPPLLSYFADRLCPGSVSKHDEADMFFKHQTSAYYMALAELSARK